MAKLVIITTLALIVACAIATPAKSKKSWINLVFRLWSPCDRISFTQKTGVTYTVFHEQNKEQCNELAGSTQTEITLLARKQIKCAYKLIEYSGYDCNENQVVNTALLNQRNPVVKLNERRSVCSYKLGKEIKPKHSVIVTFRGGNIPILTHELSRADLNCYNLCNSPKDNNFPSWVEVHDQAGNVVTDNYIELFSKPSCADSSIIKRSNGTRAIVTSENLDNLTRLYRDKVVGSFRIAKLK